MGKLLPGPFVIWWVVATGVGWTLAHPLLQLVALEALPLWGGALVAVATGVGLAQVYGRRRQGMPARWWSLGGNAGWAVIAVIAIALGHPGSMAGLFQWTVLRSHLRSGARWILAGVLGALLLMLIQGILIANAYESAVIAGLLLGIPQWLVLRRQLARAGWWVLLSPAGWLAGTLAAMAAGNAYNLSSGYMNETTALVVAHTVPNLIGGAVCGVVTGVGLTRLARHTARSTAPVAPVHISLPGGGP